jgi:trans-aconitate methyltransferase
MSAVVQPKWDAQSYHENSSAQQTAARQLLSRVHFAPDQHILDVGCGDGKITFEIAHRSILSCVHGIDISLDMVRFAQSKYQECKNLTFSVQNAETLSEREKFDMLFSSFALQWIEDIGRFIGAAHRALKPGGQFVATIPLSISRPLEAALTKTTSSPIWEPFFKHFATGWHFQKPSIYKELLVTNEFRILQFDLTMQEQVFPSRKHLEDYIRQWLTHLSRLPEEQKAPFFKELMDDYFSREPIGVDGHAYLRFERVDIIAQKT